MTSAQQHDLPATDPQSLSHSTVGNRQVVQTNLQRLMDALEKDSEFFSRTQAAFVPAFESQEIEFGNELGRGEFGVVYSVKAIHPSASHEACHCGKCARKLSRQTSRRHNNSNTNLSGMNPQEANLPQETTAADDENVSTRHHRNFSTDNEAKDEVEGSPAGDVEALVPPFESIPVSPQPRAAATTTDSNDTVGSKSMTKPPSILRSQHYGVGGHHSTTPSLVSKVSFAGLDQIVVDHPSNQSTATSEGYRPPSITVELQADDSSTLSGDDDTFSLASEDGEVDFLRAYMSSHCWRNGKPRYAVKLLRQGMVEAAMDLASEAKFLRHIVHPNIVRIRGTVGTPGTNTFGMVLDCLQMTLREKMNQWQAEEQALMKAQRRKIFSIFRKDKKSTPSVHQQQQADIFADKLLALYDIARAMRYLHNNMILFRDLKPENIAVDVRGDMRLFDFGLAKELKSCDRRDDGYSATGLTGSRRYMAPEVVLCKHYDLSADVYSFTIVMWEVWNSELSWLTLDLDQHFEKVVLQGKRPPISKRMQKQIPQQLIVLLQQGWAASPTERPTFKSLCRVLEDRLTVLEATSVRSVGSDRTNYLLNRSNRSRAESQEKVNPPGL